MVRQEGTMVWWDGCSWLADRGPREIKLPFWKEVMEGLEIKLKNVPQTLFLNEATSLAEAPKAY